MKSDGSHTTIAPKTLPLLLPVSTREHAGIFTRVSRSILSYRYHLIALMQGLEESRISMSIALSANLVFQLYRCLLK